MKQSLSLGNNRATIAHDFMQISQVKRTFGRKIIGSVAQTVACVQSEQRATFNPAHPILHEKDASAQKPVQTDDDSSGNSVVSSAMSHNSDDDIMYFPDNESTAEGEEDENSVSSAESAIAPVNLAQSFREYVACAQNNTIALTKKYRTAIRLLLSLRKTKASLSTCESELRTGTSRPTSP